MLSQAVTFKAPFEIELTDVVLKARQESDVVVETLWSGISSGTEKLFWNGDMPFFPGMQYPLVPGYESVGRVCQSPAGSALHEGELVFVPGANCYRDVAGLFGGSASRLLVDEDRLIPLPSDLGRNGVLLALAATAYRAVAKAGDRDVDLIVGHGVLGCLMARICLALGKKPPVVWETDPARRPVGQRYIVTEPGEITPCGVAIDASGDLAALDVIVTSCRRGGQIILAGFYEDRLSVAFTPAFMREVSLHISAEFLPEDMAAVLTLVKSSKLSLDGLITHEMNHTSAADAYEVAFGQPDCLKMVLNWKGAA